MAKKIYKIYFDEPEYVRVKFYIEPILCKVNDISQISKYLKKVLIKVLQSCDFCKGCRGCEFGKFDNGHDDESKKYKPEELFEFCIDNGYDTIKIYEVLEQKSDEWTEHEKKEYPSDDESDIFFRNQEILVWSFHESGYEFCTTSELSIKD